MSGLAERVHAIVDALAGDAVGDDERLAALARLLAQARGEVELEFGVTGNEGPLARMRREWSEFRARALGELEARCWVGDGRLRTRVGWTGDLQLVLGPGVGADERASHVRSLRAQFERQARRLEVLTAVAVAARRVAGLIAGPGAAMVSALPVAFACVREAHARGEGGGVPWE